MPPKTVAEIERRQRAVPWDCPILVHFACDDQPLYGCRRCILRFGLRLGDHTRLFGSEAEAFAHIATHRDPKNEEKRPRAIAA